MHQQMIASSSQLTFLALLFFEKTTIILIRNKLSHRKQQELKIY